MKAFLAKQDPAETIAVLQTQVDRFVAYYNDVRPHRAVGRRPPIVAFDARDKARPSGAKIRVGAGVRVRRDRIDKHGRVTLRHRTNLHHLGIGARHRGKRVILLVKDLDVRVVSLDGELLAISRSIRAGTTNRRNREGRLRCSDTSGHDAPTHDTVGCSQNSLTWANATPVRECPQVKRGCTHSRSEAVSVGDRPSQDTGCRPSSGRLEVAGAAGILDRVARMTPTTAHQSARPAKPTKPM